MAACQVSVLSDYIVKPLHGWCEDSDLKINERAKERSFGTEVLEWT
jgi:hypothetical protein